MRWGYQKVSENGIVRNSEGAASAALSISLTIFPRPEQPHPEGYVNRFLKGDGR